MSKPEFATSNAAELADAYGSLSAQIKTIEATMKLIKEEMIFRGASEYNGSVFDVTVTHQVSKVLDTESVKQFLGKRVENFMIERKSIVLRPKASLFAEKAA